MNDDPADERADTRRRLQLSRELEVDRQSLIHPSVGGTRGYRLVKISMENLVMTFRVMLWHCRPTAGH